MNTLFMVSTLVLSGGQVLFGLCAVATLIFGGVLLAKKYFSLQSEKLLKEEQIGNSSTLLRKHDAVDIMNHQTSFKLVGLVSSLAFIFIIFAWTTCDINATLAAFIGEPEPLDMLAPVTSQKEEQQLPPALPPPPKPNPIDFEITDVPELPSTDKTEPTENNTPNDYTGPTDKNGTTYVAPTSGGGYTKETVVEEPVVDEEPIPFADQMPRFPGCEDGTGNNDAKKACADQKLLAYINSCIQYPAAARELGVEGMVVVSFVVGKDGSISDMKILKDPGAGCGKEALRVVKKMSELGQKWTPGKQQGRTVKVRYNLPVRFKLN